MRSILFYACWAERTPFRHFGFGSSLFLRAFPFSQKGKMQRSQHFRLNWKIALLTLLVASTGFDQFEVSLAAGNIRLSYLVYFLLFLIFRKRFQFRASQTLFLAISFCWLFSAFSRSIVFYAALFT